MTSGGSTSAGSTSLISTTDVSSDAQAAGDVTKKSRLSLSAPKIGLWIQLRKNKTFTGKQSRRSMKNKYRSSRGKSKKLE